MRGQLEVHAGPSGSAEFGVGQRWEVPSGYALQFVSNGNLEVINPVNRVVWQSGTIGSGAQKLSLQRDGNLVLYAHGGKPVWASNTQGNEGAYLVVQSDGDIVLRRADRMAIWATGTAEK